MSQEFLDKLYILHRELTDAIDDARIDKKDIEYIQKLEDMRINISTRASQIRRQLNYKK